MGGREPVLWRIVADDPHDLWGRFCIRRRPCSVLRSRWREASKGAPSHVSCQRWLPERRRGEAGSLHQGLQLGPGDLGVDLAAPSRGPKATVGAGNDPLAPPHLGIAHNPLGDQLWMFNE